MSELRTLDAAILEIKQRDPRTSLTRYALRRAVIEGRIPCVMIGRKRLVEMERVSAYFKGVKGDGTNDGESKANHD